MGHYEREFTCHFPDGVVAKPGLRHTCVIMVAKAGEQVLVVQRHPDLVGGGKYALPGGYMNGGETAEEAAKREFLEETGHTVGECQFFRLYSGPEDPAGNVVLYFAGELGEKIGEGDWESTECRLVGREEVGTVGEFAFGHDEIIREFWRWQTEGRQELLVG